MTSKLGDLIKQRDANRINNKTLLRESIFFPIGTLCILVLNLFQNWTFFLLPIPLLVSFISVYQFFQGRALDKHLLRLIRIVGKQERDEIYKRLNEAYEGFNEAYDQYENPSKYNNTTLKQSSPFFSTPFSKESLKKQYKELAKIHHPDIGGNTDTFKSLNNEYSKLLKLAI